jgi:hypothetical protein
MAEISLQGLNAYNSGMNQSAQQVNAAYQAKPQETEKVAEQPKQAEQVKPDNTRLFDKLKVDDKGQNVFKQMQGALSKMKGGIGQFSGIAGHEDTSLDALSKAIEDFKEGYNSMLDAAKNSDDEGVLAIGLSMASRTNMYGSALSEVGVTTDEENKMEYDPEQAKKDAAMKAAMELFHGDYSYGQKTANDVQTFMDKLRQDPYSKNNQNLGLGLDLFATM